MFAHNKKGFTIVELVIVIVVIGILTAITIVAYTGIQKDGRDSIRKSDLAAIAKAILIYNSQRGDYAEAGCGSGTGSGYYLSDYDGTGPNKSVSACLMDPGYLTKEFVDPSGSRSCSGLSCYTYMKASCTTGLYPGTYVYAHLETLPQVSTDTDETCRSDWDTVYGMNYYVKVNL